ncbi:MAG: thiol-disulfide isomerase/thioredoxin [Patiriisocius sp.]|jgi:thiol-disulfide isomerase/thioredoxin
MEKRYSSKKNHIIPKFRSHYQSIYIKIMHKLILSVVLLFSSQSFSQSITMEFPAFAGKTYDFIIFQGSKQETVQQDTIPANGKFTLKIPKQYAPYTGMSRWLITNTAEGGGLDMAIPGYDFSVSCLSATPDNNNISYKGFDAVNELNRLHTKQQAIIDKFETMSKAVQLYDKKHQLYAAFTKEAAMHVKAYDAFQQDLKQNTNFNARFLPIVNLVNGIPHRLTDDYNQKALLVNEFITQKLSFEDMWVSGHWQGIIQSWVVLQMNVVNDKAQFAQDFKKISDRIKNPVHYTDFVGKLTYYLTEYSKDDYINAIAKTVLESGKVTEYVGSMQVYLKAMVGMKAPDLIVPAQIGGEQTTILNTNELDSKYTLLFFYQSDCGHCETAIAALKSQYQDLVAKGIEIISIAGDLDPNTFATTAASFPWTTKYRDVEGMNGINFKNYAVIGTPTIYVLDSKGVIIQKPATMEEVLEWSGK